MGQRWGICGAVTATAFLVLPLSAACSSLLPAPVPTTTDPDVGLVGRCPKTTYPCGNGCMPLNAACCDDGTRQTSNYCTNSAGGGCQPNPTHACIAPAPSGTLSDRPPSAFCCTNAPSAKPEGSFDCPEGTHHCTGPSCVPIGQACCTPGSSNADCPAAADDTAGGKTCLPQPGVGCGVTGGFCYSCPLGSCCASDPTNANGSGRKCLPPTGVCTGTQGNGGGGPPANNCKLVWDCKTSTQCADVYGAPTGSAAEPDKATCDAVCKMQGACTCQGCS